MSFCSKNVDHFYLMDVQNFSQYGTVFGEIYITRINNVVKF